MATMPPLLKRLLRVGICAYVFVRLVRIIKVLRERVRCMRLIEKQIPMVTDAPEHRIGGHFFGQWCVPRVKGEGSLPLDEQINRLQLNLVSFLKRCAHTPEVQDSELVRHTTLFNSAIINWFPFLPHSSICVTGMDTARELLSAKNLDSLVKGKSYNTASPLIGHGSILSASGPKWLHQRKVIDKGFKRSLMEKALPLVLKTNNELIGALKRKLQQAEDISEGSAAKGVKIDLHETMLNLTMDVLGRVVFSTDFNSVTAETIDDAPLYNAFHVILHTLTVRNLFMVNQLTKSFPTAFNRKFDDSMAVLDNHVRTLIQARLNVPDIEKQDQPKDLLDMMIRATDSTEEDDVDNDDVRLQRNNSNPNSGSRKSTPKGQGLTFQELLDSTKTMLFAGHDTTGAALAWLIYLLAKDRDMMDRVRGEISDVVKGEWDVNEKDVKSEDVQSNDPTLEDIENMPVLNACVKEVLRLYPSAAFTRSTTKDLVLTGGKTAVKAGKKPITLPKGTDVAFFPYILQRDPKVYSRPDEFVPDRWLTEGDKAAEESRSSRATGRPRKFSNAGSSNLQGDLGVESCRNAYLPFSLGPRSCVGRPLALLELRVVVIKLLQHFDFDLVHDDAAFQDCPKLSMTLEPASLKIIVKPLR